MINCGELLTTDKYVEYVEIVEVVSQLLVNVQSHSQAAVILFIIVY